jgi:Ser/Thr protein kinase RdoA (MazF antagonist)
MGVGDVTGRDCGAQNVIMCASGDDHAVGAFIDFEDCSYSFRVNELAVALAYTAMRALRTHPDAVAAEAVAICGHVVAGFASVIPLLPAELQGAASVSARVGR